MADLIDRQAAIHALWKALFKYEDEAEKKFQESPDLDLYEWKHFERGDKISQLVILPIFTPELELVESLGETEHGDNGFGSTGR